MAQQFIRVPLDSAGKRVSHALEIEIYLAGDQTSNIKPGDRLSTAGGFNGTTASVRIDSGNTKISTVVDENSSSADTSAGESLFVNGILIGTVLSVPDSGQFYIQKNIIASGTNPYNVVKVNDFGELSVDVGVEDSFNRQSVSNPTTVRNYTFNNDNDHLFYTKLLIGGTKVHVPSISGIRISTTSNNSSHSSLTSHINHYYSPGLSQTVLMTTSSGDSGKVGNIREWGLFDDNDGLFFRLNGTTVSVVIRSSVNGTIEEREVIQANWNTNKLNGVGGYLNIGEGVLDVTKDTIYWIDFQWLGAGRVRFGTYFQGKKITCHEFSNTNLSARPYMRTGSLPLRFLNSNVATTSGTSELTVYCATILTGGQISPYFRTFGRLHVGVEVANSDTNRFVVSSMRMKSTFKGTINKSIGLPVIFSLYSATHPVVFEIVKNGTLTGIPTETEWSRNPSNDSAVEFDYAYDSITGGNVIVSRIISPGKSVDIDMTKQFGLDRELVLRHADGVNYDQYSFCMRTLYPAVSSDVWISLEWNELQM